MKPFLLAIDLGFGSLIDALLQFIYGLLWDLLMWIKWVFDFCYNLVRQLAGLETYYYKGLESTPGGAGTVTGDIIEVILKTDIIRNLLISLLVLGIILLFIITFVSVWKTEWEFGKEGNSKTKIFNNAIRALINFIAVPVITFFGIFVGNALLRAIDSATKGNNQITMSNMVFNSLMYNAVRSDHEENAKNADIVNANLVTTEEGVKGIYLYFTNASGDIDASLVLEAFRSEHVLTDTSYAVFDIEDDLLAEGTLTHQIANGGLVFSVENDELVDVFFDVGEVNYIVGFLVLVIMLKCMLEITYGLVKRLFYMIMLFIVSPPIVAMSPINEKILGSWRSLFVSNACCAFITIALYNIFISIYPIFNDITLFPATAAFGTLNSFVSLLFVAVGLLTISELITELSKLLGFSNIQNMSLDKNGNSLWGGAFGMAGKALKPGAALTAGTVGKVFQYGRTAKYEGAGSVFKQMGKDTQSVARSSSKKLIASTQLDKLAKSAGMNKDGALKGFANYKSMDDKYMIADTKKALHETRSSAKDDINTSKASLKSAFGKDFAESVEYLNMKRQNEKLNIETNIEAYQKSGRAYELAEKTVNTLQEKIAQKEARGENADSDKQALRLAQARMDKNKDMYEAYTAYEKMMKSGVNGLKLDEQQEILDRLKQGGIDASRQLIKENSNLKQNSQNKAMAEDIKSAIKEQDAKKLAQKNNTKEIIKEAGEALNSAKNAQNAATKADLEKVQRQLKNLVNSGNNSREVVQMLKKLETQINKIEKKK